MWNACNKNLLNVFYGGMQVTFKGLGPDSELPKVGSQADIWSASETGML